MWSGPWTASSNGTWSSRAREISQRRALHRHTTGKLLHAADCRVERNQRPPDCCTGKWIYSKLTQHHYETRDRSNKHNWSVFRTMGSDSDASSMRLALTAIAISDE